MHEKPRCESYRRPTRCRFSIGSAMRGVGLALAGKIHIRGKVLIASQRLDFGSHWSFWHQSSAIDFSTYTVLSNAHGI